MASVYEALAHCSLFLAIGVPVAAEPASGFAEAARRAGARRIAFTPEPAIRPRPVRRAHRRPARRDRAGPCQAADRRDIESENASWRKRLSATSSTRRNGPAAVGPSRRQFRPHSSAILMPWRGVRDTGNPELNAADPIESLDITRWVAGCKFSCRIRQTLRRVQPRIVPAWPAVRPRITSGSAGMSLNDAGRYPLL